MNVPNGGIGFKMSDFTNTAYEDDSDVLAEPEDQSETTEDEFLDNEYYSPSRESSVADEHEVKEWDVFMTKEEQKKEYKEKWEHLHKVLRCIVCGIIFILTLASGVASTLSVLLLTYNINTSGANFTLKAKGGGSAYVIKDGRRETNVRWIWALILIICAPYLFTFVRSLLQMIFKRQTRIKFIPLIVVLITESLHSLGLLTLVFVVLPYLDAILAILLLQGTATVPSLLRLVWRKNKNFEMSPLVAKDKAGSSTWRLVALLACVFQLAFVVMATYKLFDSTGSLELAVTVPASLVLISLGYWDNFVQASKKSSSWREHEMKNKRWEVPKDVKYLVKLIERNKVKLTLISSVWKIVLTLCVPSFYFSVGNADCLDALFFQTTSAQNCTPHSVSLTDTTTGNCSSWYYLPFAVAAVHIVCSLLGYVTAKGACKIRAQGFCFSLPLALSTPFSLVLVLTSYVYRQPLMDSFACQNVWFALPAGEDLIGFLRLYTTELWMPLIVLGFVSFILVNGHVWAPRNRRMASTDRLFIKPLYCAVMFSQSMILSRRTNDTVKTKRKQQEQLLEVNKHYRDDSAIQPRTDANTPMIYACATMWHETENEMSHLLKSLFWMDLDQFKRTMLWRCFKIHDPDYYEFEAHIFFDNAFEDHASDDYEYTVNKYVKTFTKVFSEAARCVYGPQVKIDLPLKVPTPYGGRLEYLLPGQNLLVVHLKNKDKVRIKKRWSQVMYMYYFLSHKLVCKNQDPRILDKKARNTFLLALDGDVDFSPSAVQLLLDRMKNNGNVGAACGRIHPVGSGPVVWYQKFEYAVSHWLQKAAEHKLGCVLCCPGCFSMFRASALMDFNVVKKYAQVATEAKHYVQYDQGEDRWLCTLILQQGHRIEYCAAADAKTFAPEGFKEFFNQRRRWTPSTMANILDIIMSGKRIREKNDDISLLFIMYQIFLFVSSVLTPGTIFMLIFGAINTAYPGMSLYAAMLANLVPVGIFVILCFTTKDDIQITYVSILSAFYSLVMMIVVVGLLKQIVQSSFCSLTAMFFFYVVAVFIIAAVAHPQEFVNVLHGFLYFLVTPCSSMLLIFYSLANLHVVSWGTREEYKPPQTQMTEMKSDQKQKKNNKKKKKMKMIGFEARTAEDGNKSYSSDFTFSFGNMLRCICCPRLDNKPQEMLEVIVDKIEDLEYAFRHRDDDDSDDVDDVERPVAQPARGEMPKFSSQDVEGIRLNPLFRDEPQTYRDDMKNPFWIEDRDLGAGGIGILAADEHEFWVNMIEKYLLPLKLSTQEKQKKEAELKGLRNKVCLFFFLSNSLFVTLIFILESVSEYTPSLIFQLPCDAQGLSPAKIEPIAIAFTFIFGILLLIQFLTMVMHRYSTLLHIVSSTKIRLKGKSMFEKKKKEIMLNILEELQTVDQDYDTESLRSSSCSEYGGDSTVGGTMKAKQRSNLMRQITMKRAANETSGMNLQSLVENKFRLMGEALEDVDDDEDVARKPVFKKLGAKSLFDLVKMDPNEKQRIINRSKQNWDKLRQQFPLPKPRMSVCPKMAEWVKLAVEKTQQGSLDADVTADVTASTSGTNETNQTNGKGSLWIKHKSSLGNIINMSKHKDEDASKTFEGMSPIEEHVKGDNSEEQLNGDQSEKAEVTLRSHKEETTTEGSEGLSEAKINSRRQIISETKF